jgi:sugar lactone lactonase YvrE
VLATGGEASTVDSGGAVSLVAASGQLVWVTSATGEVRAFDPATSRVLSRAALPGRPTAIAAAGTGVAVATDDGTISYLDAPGASPRVLTRPGAVLTSLAISGDLLFGTSPTTALLYRMEIPS